MQNTKAYAAIIDYLIQFGVSRIHEGEETDHRPTLERMSEWRWSDEQYAFNEKWMKACKRHDPWLYRPLMVDFAEDGTATVGTRMRHDIDGMRPTAVVPNWKKITQKALAETYISLVAQHKAKKGNAV